MLDHQTIRRIRAEAHHLKPEFQIGKEGLNDSLIAAIYDAFNTKELLKVRMLDTSPDSRETLRERFSQLPEITLVQNIGHTYILHKPLDRKKNTPTDGK